LWRWFVGTVVEARKRMLGKLSRSYVACPVKRQKALMTIEFNSNQIDKARKKIDLFFSQIIDGPGFGNILIEFNKEKARIDVSSTLNHRFLNNNEDK